MERPSTSRNPLFSRQALLIVAFLCCCLTVGATWLLRGRQWNATLPLLSVAMTLMVVIPLGEFIRNRLKLSLRSMLVLMTALALLIGLFGANANNARIQRRAVQSVLALKRSSPDLPQPYSEVYYVQEAYGADFIRTKGGWIVPAWFLNVFGRDFFFEIRDISIQNQELSTAGALDAVELEQFENIYFSNCRLGPDAWRRIASLRQLRHLFLVNVAITDSDLKTLSSLNDLQTLSIRNHRSAGLQNSVSDRGLQHIAELSNLRQLDVSNTSVTGSGLATLQSLKKLELLDVSHNAVTNQDVAVLARYPSLYGVNLADTHVNEDSIASLQKLPSLDWAFITPSSGEVRAKLAQEMESNPFKKPTIHMR